MKRSAGTHRRAGGQRESRDVVRVEKWKRPYGVVSAWDAYVVGEDGHGLWLHSPKDSVHHLRNGEAWIVPWDGVQLLPSGSRWWVAWFWDRVGARWTAADVCTPAVFEGGRWSYVDLELDPVGTEGGFDHLADEDEFRDAVVAGHISLDEERMAMAAAREVEALMTSVDEPFVIGWSVLDRAVELRLPPTP